jgi:CBS domain-containing protein
MPSMLQVLASKGSQVWSISPDATVFAGLTLMADKNIGALLILENDRPVGIMSERDYARKIILEGRSSRDTKIRSIMTTRLVSVSPSDSVEHAMALMTREHIRHLPVMEGNSVLGLVSIGDLVNTIISAQSMEINQLHSYIAGQYPG